jgi:hypothetical protein
MWNGYDLLMTLGLVLVSVVWLYWENSHHSGVQVERYSDASTVVCVDRHVIIDYDGRVLATLPVA